MPGWIIGCLAEAIQVNSIEDAINKIYSGIEPNENISESTVLDAYSNIHNNVFYRTFIENFSKNCLFYFISNLDK
jgi:hypothetical protein